MKPAAGEARNSTASATSSGVPVRRMGVARTAPSTILRPTGWASRASRNPVSVTAGDTQLTRTP